MANFIKCWDKVWKSCCNKISTFFQFNENLDVGFAYNMELALIVRIHDVIMDYYYDWQFFFYIQCGKYFVDPGKKVQGNLVLSKTKFYWLIIFYSGD